MIIQTTKQTENRIFVVHFIRTDKHSNIIITRTRDSVVRKNIVNNTARAKLQNVGNRCVIVTVIILLYYYFCIMYQKQKMGKRRIPEQTK